MLRSVRSSLLNEAKQSPGLLSDLAGLEQYVAESYDSRSFVELLQNADDAGSSRFLIEKHGGLLFVGNDGQPFTANDLESLCRSASSTKTRGTSIGYRGIGFKSVVSLSKTIHLVSGGLEATFSKEKTAKAIPLATRVPLIRIPHPIEDVERQPFSHILARLQNDGFTTVFVFSDLLADAIDNEFSSFNFSSLLFLRNIRQVELRTRTETVVTVQRETIDSAMRSVRLASTESVSRWLIVENNDVAIAFNQRLEHFENLDESDAVVHAFLPTLEPTGLAVKIHGDISTDPTRTRVVFDERTASTIEKVASLILNIIENAITGKPLPDSIGMLTALIPLTDPRLNKLQKRSFKTELMNDLQRLAEKRFECWTCRPDWLNPLDFERLSKFVGTQTIPRHFEAIKGLNSFLRFLSIKDASFDYLSTGLLHAELTIIGAAEIVADLVRRYSTNQLDVRSINREWRLWPIRGANRSLEQAAANSLPIDNDFKDMVSEKAMGESGLRRLLSAMCNSTTVAGLLPKQADAVLLSSVGMTAMPQSVATTLSIKPISLKRWRGAEEQLRNILAAQGWMVEDVSRQNIGYDIACRKQNGEELFVEVKMIDFPNQPFTLTSNEEAVARQLSCRYVIAVVCQAGEFLELSLIHDPINNVKSLTRQCRQWVWECSDYPWVPQRFSLE